MALYTTIEKRLALSHGHVPCITGDRLSFLRGGRYADALFIWVKTRFLPNSNVVVGAGADAALGVAEGSQRLHPCLS